MKKNLLLIIIFIFILNTFSKTVTAQNLQTPSKTDAKKNQSEDELLRDLLFCECLQQIHAPAHEEASKLPSLNKSISINEWLIEWRKKWVQQGPDPNHAHDPVTGQNYNWDSDKKAWIDSKTGECICPKCETAKEDKKEIKEKKTAMKEKTAYKTPKTPSKLSIAAGVGYGFSLNKGLLGENKTFTASNRSFDGVYGSWAEGENFYLRSDFMLCACFWGGLEFDYTNGKKYKWTTNTTGPTLSTDQYYEEQYTGYSITPFVMMNPCHKKQWNPFAMMGLRYNFSNSIKETLDQTQTSNNNTTTSRQEGTLKGKPSLGFDASLGVNYKFNNRWALNLELNTSHSNFIPDTWTLNKYTVNGADQIGSLNTSQKQTNYLKSYTIPTATTDPNSPTKAIQDPQPANYLGVRIGIRCSF